MQHKLNFYTFFLCDFYETSESQLLKIHALLREIGVLRYGTMRAYQHGLSQ